MEFRRLCRAEFLNYLRVREWQDIYYQLRQVVRTLNLTLTEDREELAEGPVVFHAQLIESPYVWAWASSTPSSRRSRMKNF